MLLQHFTEACACCIFHAPYKNLMHSSSLCNPWWWVYPFWFAHIICTWSGMLHWQFIEYSNHTNVSNQRGWNALFCRPNMLGGLSRVLVPKSLISVGMFPVASWDIRCPLFWPPSSLLSILSPCSVDLLYPVWLICKNSISWHKITDNSPALQQINDINMHTFYIRQIPVTIITLWQKVCITQCNGRYILCFSPQMVILLTLFDSGAQKVTRS